MPDLPLELLFAVVDCLPAIPSPCLNVTDGLPDNAWRSQTLLALAQTCRALRQTFLPVAWESFDFVCETGSTGDDDGRLVKKLYHVLDSPETQNYIKTVNVSFYNFASLDTFTLFLSALPNVDTVQFLCSQFPFEPVCPTSGNLHALNASKIATFENIKFHSIKTLTIPYNALGILDSFPGVTHAAVLGEGHIMNVFGQLVCLGPTLEYISFSDGWENDEMSQMLTLLTLGRISFPHIREFPLRVNMRKGALLFQIKEFKFHGILDALVDLTTINFEAHDRSDLTNPKAIEMIESAKHTIERSRVPPDVKRELRIFYDDGECDVIDVVPLSVCSPNPQKQNQKNSHVVRMPLAQLVEDVRVTS